MIGLVCSPEILGQIRSSRLASLGLGMRPVIPMLNGLNKN